MKNEKRKKKVSASNESQSGNSAGRRDKNIVEGHLDAKKRLVHTDKILECMNNTNESVNLDVLDEHLPPPPPLRGHPLPPPSH